MAEHEDDGVLPEGVEKQRVRHQQHARPHIR
jgi:hypothetical protein